MELPGCSWTPVRLEPCVLLRAGLEMTQYAAICLDKDPQGGASLVIQSALLIKDMLCLLTLRGSGVWPAGLLVAW